MASTDRGDRKLDSPFDLLTLLIRCRELSEASQDAIYSYMTCDEIVTVLNRGIDSLGNGTELNHEELKLLFAPTGALQDTAMENGWSGEYLRLSSQFDTLIEDSDVNDGRPGA